MSSRQYVILCGFVFAMKFVILPLHEFIPFPKETLRLFFPVFHQPLTSQGCIKCKLQISCNAGKHAPLGIYPYNDRRYLKPIGKIAAPESARVHYFFITRDGERKAGIHILLYVLPSAPLENSKYLSFIRGLTLCWQSTMQLPPVEVASQWPPPHYVDLVVRGLGFLVTGLLLSSLATAIVGLRIFTRLNCLKMLRH
jgi:hypothetical protein